jgi:hypothetical protein
MGHSGAMAGMAKLIISQLTRAIGHCFGRFLAENGEETQGFLTLEFWWHGESSYTVCNGGFCSSGLVDGDWPLRWSSVLKKVHCSFLVLLSSFTSGQIAPKVIGRLSSKIA